MKDLSEDYFCPVCDTELDSESQVEYDKDGAHTSTIIFCPKCGKTIQEILLKIKEEK